MDFSSSAVQLALAISIGAGLATVLGSFMVIDMMDIAKDLSLTWLYLGYFVAESRKMAYKARFGPAEIFKDGFWQAANGALTTSA